MLIDPDSMQTYCSDRSILLSLFLFSLPLYVFNTKQCLVPNQDSVHQQLEIKIVQMQYSNTSLGGGVRTA